MHEFVKKMDSEFIRRIIADLDFQKGLDYGKPRPGHPEGEVRHHIAEVLDNVEKMAKERKLRSETITRLVLIALIHDTFKYKVDRSKPRHGQNHHGYLARKFAEGYIADPDVLEVIELHDEAFLSYQKGARDDEWNKADARLEQLLARLGSPEGYRLRLYYYFFKCDNETGDKESESFEWFRRKVNGKYKFDT